MTKKPSAKKPKAEWPKRVTIGSVTVKVYRSRVRSNANGFGYDVVWNTPSEGRQKQQFADPTRALEEAGIKASQLAAGRVEGAEMTTGDRDELRAARKLVEGKRPLLAAIDEWLKAWDLTGGHVLDAAGAWAKKHVTTFKKVLATVAVKEFIAYKITRGKKAERTYGSKLRVPVTAYFPERYLDEITVIEWSKYLNQWSDGVTQNDFRKRAVEMCRWARDVAGYLPRGVPTEIELTERVPEEATEIGTLTPEVWRAALHWMHANHIEHLAALVVAGFMGLRSDEIHGKRDDRKNLGDDCKRQTWEDIDLVQKHLNVTNAKTNTPAWRLAPICDAAIEWFALCPGEHKGPICVPGAMEKARWVLLNLAKIDLPENCFRHSYITYEIAVTGNKAQVAEWAGNSEKEINKRYRRPALPATGRAWFASGPNVK